MDSRSTGDRSSQVVDQVAGGLWWVIYGDFYWVYMFESLEVSGSCFMIPVYQLFWSFSVHF